MGQRRGPGTVVRRRCQSSLRGSPWLVSRANMARRARLVTRLDAGGGRACRLIGINARGGALWHGRRSAAAGGGPIMTWQLSKAGRAAVIALAALAGGAGVGAADSVE